MGNAELHSITEELNRTSSLPIYEAFDTTWIAVIKIANRLPGSREHDRLLELLNRLPDASVYHILHRQEVDILLNLEPPLETVLSFPHERLNAERTSEELAIVQRYRQSNPKRALRALAKVLNRIRNRRAHGFKTPDGPRDQEVLGSALALLRLVGLTGAEVLDSEGIIASGSHTTSRSASSP